MLSKDDIFFSKISLGEKKKKRYFLRYKKKLKKQKKKKKKKTIRKNKRDYTITDDTNKTCSGDMIIVFNSF